MTTWNRLASIAMFALLSMFQHADADSIDDLQLHDGTKNSPVVTIRDSTAVGEHSVSAATHDPSGRDNQDLVSAPTSLGPRSVPEPGTGMMGLVGVAWAVAFRRWYRRRRGRGGRG